MCLWPNCSTHPPETGKGEDPNKLQRSLEIQLRHEAASPLQDKLAVTKNTEGQRRFLSSGCICRGVSHAVSLISTKMVTTSSLLKSSHRPLKSLSIYRSKSTPCWANVFRCRNQHPDYNLALSCLPLLKQMLMSQYETSPSCSQQKNKNGPLNKKKCATKLKKRATK